MGSSVNRYLLEGLARQGRGAVGYILHDEDPGHAVDALYDRITHPALTDVHVDWGGAQVSEVYPQRLPDLFVGRPVVLTGRFDGEPPLAARVVGRAGGHQVALAVETTELPSNEPLATLPAVWARSKIQSLVDFAGVDRRELLRTEIEQLALTYGLASDFTSFVAVDATERTGGSSGVTVKVPVPVPAGVRYDTTVGEK